MTSPPPAQGAVARGSFDPVTFRYRRSLSDSTSGGVTPLLLRVEEAAEVLRIGRSKLFELLATGEIDSVLIGSSRRVPFAALEDYVRRLRYSPDPRSQVAQTSPTTDADSTEEAQ